MKKGKIQEKEASHYQKVSHMFMSKKDLATLEGGRAPKSTRTETAKQTAEGERTEIRSDATVKEWASKPIEGCIELESDEYLEEKFQVDPPVEEDVC